MADPLSIASGVAGLVSLGLTLCSGLRNYFSAVKDRHQDIETATQSLTLLQSNICIIQSSTLKLGHRHALSANGVNQGLANCESQLKFLQQLMLDLTRAEGLSNIKGKWTKQKMIARYPFDQKKLIQLQDQLYKTNVTLSSFVQNFNLDINIGISEDLKILRGYTNANDSITHNMLGAIARRLDIIGPAVQRTEMEVTTVSKHTQKKSIRITSSQISDSHSKPLYLQNSENEKRLGNNLATMGCNCPNNLRDTISGSSTKLYQGWGGLIISKQEHKRQHHRPGCTLFNPSIKKSGTTLTYLGFRYLFSRIMTMSLTRDYPAGGYSLSFGLQPCNIVVTTPAFRLFHPIDSTDTAQQYFKHSDHRKAALMVIQKLSAMYNSGVASPFDVDRCGNNIAHQYLNTYLDDAAPEITAGGLSYEIAFEAIRMLLSYMFDIGVPISASNFDQRTLIDISLKPSSLRILPRLYSLITTYDTSFYANEVAHSKEMTAFQRESGTEPMKVWGEYAEIAEVVGFNEIFRVVMQQDQQRLETILADHESPPGILETDMYGRNILHVSTTWPEGLSLLLRHKYALRVLYDDYSSLCSPLELALMISGQICRAPDKWLLCEDCKCIVSVQLLLEADCAIYINEDMFRTLEECSLRSRKLFFQHLRNRRERLRDISLELLPAEVIDRYAVTADSLPDATATILWDEVQFHVWYLDQQGTVISDGLRSYGPFTVFDRLFSYAISPKLCCLASEFGFQPLDESGFEPLLSQVEIFEYAYASLSERETAMKRSLEIDIPFFNWLLDHNLEFDYAICGFQSTALHRFGARLGQHLDCLNFSDDLPSPPSQELSMLLSRIFYSEAQSNLPCPCISGAFNRPLASLLSGFIFEPIRSSFGLRMGGIIQHMILLVVLVEAATSSSHALYLVKCATHILTMTFLGIRHLSICINFDPREELCESPWADNDELAEILDEDRHLLERLHALDEEFDKEFQYRKESVKEFLQGYYYRRIKEVRREMAVPLSDGDRHGLLDAGVVLDTSDERGYDYPSDDMESEDYENDDIVDK